MCHQCDYVKLLNSARLAASENRLRVLEVIGNNRYPLPAETIFKTIERLGTINRATVYRILNLLVDHGLVERLSTGGRAFYYGLAPNAHHPPHPHFYCKGCGRMDCLHPESLQVDADRLLKTFPGRIDRLEIRVDGICQHCLRNQKETKP